MRARFEADYTSFIKATEDAKLSLKEFETGANKVQKQINAIGDSLSGRKVISEAETMAKAVSELGGAARLTEAEQRRVNAVVTEAIEKYRVLGKEAPAHLQKLADQTRQIPKSVDGITSSLTKLAGTFGIAFGTGAIVNFAGKVFDTASHIKDLSDGLDVSIENVQRFKYAAEQGGATVDDVGKAIGKMTNLLGAGDKSTIAALKQAGLSFDQIRQMRPEDAFLAITDALKNIQDPMLQTRLATELLGKSALSILPAIRDGFRDLGDAATIMSEQEVRDLEAAQQAWENLANAAITYSGKVLAATTSTVRGATSSWKAFFSFAATAIMDGAGAAGNFAAGLDAITTAGNTAKDTVLPLPGKFKTESDAAAKAAEAHAKALTAMFNAIGGIDAKQKVADLDTVTRRLADAGLLSKTALAQVVDQAKALAAAGATLTPRLQAIVDQSRELARISDLVALAQGHQKAATDLSEASWQRWQMTVAKALDTLKHAPVLLQGRDLSGIVPQVLAPTPPPIPRATTPLFTQIFGSAESFGASMSSAILGAIQGGGSPVSAALGTAGNQMGTTLAKSLSKSLVDQGSGLFSKALGGVINSALPIVGSLIGPLASKLWDSLFGTKGRTAVVDFANSLGGFDALHAKLNQLGAEGERLWIQLTQGTGRNNPEQAKKAIEAINAALDAYEKKQSSAADAAQKAADEEIAASQKVRDAMQAQVDQLDQQIRSLEESIANEAPEEVMGVVEAQTRAQIAAIKEQREAAQKAIDDTAEDAAKAADEAGTIIDDALAARDFRVKVHVDVDGLPTGFTYGTAPATLPNPGATFTGGGRRAGSAAPMVIQLQMDGRQTAEAVVPYVPGVVKAYGLD